MPTKKVASSSKTTNASAKLPSVAKSQAGIQSVEVGFALLEALTRAPAAMMLRDLAQEAGMSAAKAHRYLVSYQRLGLVVQPAFAGNRKRPSVDLHAFGLCVVSAAGAVRRHCGPSSR